MTSTARRPSRTGDAPEAAAEPLRGLRPWWSVDYGDGTGPHGPVNGTGPQMLPAPRDGSGPFPVLGGGTGPQPMPRPTNGSGAHPVVRTGPQGVLPDGSGAHPVIPDGTGPLPPVTGAPPARRKGLPKLLLLAGGVLVAVVMLAAGVLAVRTVGGAAKDARTTAAPASKKVINAGAVAGGLRRDGLTAPQASAAYPFVAGAVDAGGVPVAKNGLAVYTEEPVGGSTCCSRGDGPGRKPRGLPAEGTADDVHRGPGRRPGVEGRQGGLRPVRGPRRHPHVLRLGDQGLLRHRRLQPRHAEPAVPADGRRDAPDQEGRREAEVT
ncbi:hypothetical protein [Actinomadura madurae]|uniref:hypothetical protein n=1 Tax=Actinomadura madurae TaxID=1993 RepID=UPI0020D21836|nr:hypothetical protein [Actinomadura madurae]MCQ0009684.1 hypothetical protein [Actinomadura madurae]